MKRPILTFFLSALLPASLLASTNVPSTLSGDNQWIAAGGPYIIQGKVVVPKGSKLEILSGAQVVFQGSAALEIDGDLDVQGSAAAPAVFHLIEGGLNSEIFINGGSAKIENAKILSGVFLVTDSTLTLEGCEVTKGSGVYLQGTTKANLKNNKIYGNATGVVLDGQVQANLSFNTLVENTYGLQLKNYSKLTFRNNSVHDNQVEVVNTASPANLGGNYWGTEDYAALKAKVQGNAILKPLFSLKDVLRVYVRTQLPVITKQMSMALAAKERKEEKEEALALKKFRKEQKLAGNPGAVAPPEENEVDKALAENAPPEKPAKGKKAKPMVEEAPTPEVEEPLTPETLPPAVGQAEVTAMPNASHTLSPRADLPPDQSSASAMAAYEPSAVPAAPAAPPASTTETAPAPPATAETAPPAAPAPPVLEESIPLPPGTTASGQSPAPPSVETTMPPAPSTVAGTNETVPMPPDLGEQLPPSTGAAPAVPAPPATAAVPSVPSAAPPAVPAAAAPPVPSTSTLVSPPPAADMTSPIPPPSQLPPPPIEVQPTEEQQKALQSLQGVGGGDIDGMQAPPLDLGPDLSNPSSESAVPPPPGANGTTAPAKTESDLALPPMKDSDVAPPKDLDLPPSDDLGNINLDSRNK
ncbi:MAG TPA: right-handed parallel beta-helix repeat-containing protein [bacterium]|nr:right-handed parallel beta-helix repeat-containing protein [bacterium]